MASTTDDELDHEPNDEHDDEALLERWRDGELSAGEILLRRYYEPVQRFFLNKCSIAEVADMVQETFAACVEARDRVQRKGRFRSYLFAVAYNVFCGHLRQRYRAGTEVDLDQTSVRALTSSPSSVLAQRREQRLLLEALRAIPLKYQVTLELHYWEQLSTNDIAEVLAVPAGTIRTRLGRARDALEAAMGRLALSPEELDSTLTNLEQWAEACREAISVPVPGPGAPPG